MSSIRWPRPVAYVSHFAMSEDTVDFRPDTRTHRHTPLYSKADVEKLLDKQRRQSLGAPHGIQVVGRYTGVGK